MSDKEADLESVIRSGQSAQDRRRMTLVNDDPPDCNPAEGQSEETIEQLRSSGQAAQDRRQITSVEDDLTEGQDETVEEDRGELVEEEPVEEENSRYDAYLCRSLIEKVAVVW